LGKRWSSRHKRFLKHQTQDQKRNSPNHIKVRTLSVQNKERIFKAENEEIQVIYVTFIFYIKISADFSKETLKSRKT
jgi:hypothetical protein